jgi:hypothetical protein
MTYIEMVDVLKSELIPHDRLESTLVNMKARCRAAEPGEPVVQVGPSRVGKTIVLKSAKNDLVGEEKSWADTHIPAIYVQAANFAHGSRIELKHFIAKLLHELKHPNYSEPEMDHPNYLEWGEKVARRIDTATLARLMAALTKVLAYRHTRYIFIDEAQHVQRATGGAGPILDSWKSLGNETGVIIVMGGTYPLLGVMQDSPHFLGRTRVTHFSRYNAKVPSDVESFSDVLATLDHEFQLPVRLLDYAEVLCESFYGCVGHFSRGLRDALSLCVEDGSDLDINKVLAEVPLELDGRPIWTEMAQGEAVFNRLVSARKIVAIGPSSMPPTDSATQPVNDEIKPKKSGKRKPGPWRRNPSRLEKTEIELDSYEDGGAQ